MNSLLTDRATLSPDTQAVLLLCSNLGASGDVRPLTIAEYNRLAIWLKDHNRRPSDLVETGCPPEIAHGTNLPSIDRVESLLDRGRLLALALTKWETFGIWIFSRGDAAYPERLKKLRAKAPPLLFGVGAIEALNRGGLAMVGSRDVDAEGIQFTQAVARRCAEQQFPIVSGGARGVDQEAMKAALDAGGTTVTVPADSLLKAATNRANRNALRDHRLTMISPADPEAGFTVYGAMDRNKYIYALSDFALVVRFKTGEGGTWAGAVEQLANKAGASPIPVYVRVAHNPPEGWQQLERMGAFPFPESEFHTRPIRDLLHRPASNSTDLFNLPPEPTVEPVIEAIAVVEPIPPTPAIVAMVPEPVVEQPVPRSCYDQFLILLLPELVAEPTKKLLPDIAKRLDLVPMQFNKWFDRAIAEGKVITKKKGRSNVYMQPPSENPELN